MSNFNLPAINDFSSVMQLIESREGTSFSGASKRLIGCIATLFLIAYLITATVAPFFFIPSGVDLGGIGIFVTGAFWIIGLLALWGLTKWMRSSKRVLFPNIENAKNALKVDYSYDESELIKELKARSPSEREKDLFTTSLQTFKSKEGLFFENWYLIPSSLPIALSFRDSLFLSRETLESEDFNYILAHQLGKLNTGESYARHAVWKAGRSLFSGKTTLFGAVVDDDESGFNPRDLADIGIDIANKDWISVVGLLAVKVVTGGGVGVSKSLPEIEEYFNKWDMEADLIAVKYVDVQGYMNWLDQLSRFEGTIGKSPFSASAELRLDRVRYAYESGKLDE